MKHSEMNSPTSFNYLLMRQKPRSQEADTLASFIIALICFLCESKKKIVLTLDFRQMPTVPQTLVQNVSQEIQIHDYGNIMLLTFC